MHAGALLNGLSRLRGLAWLKCGLAALLYGALVCGASAQPAVPAPDSGRFVALILPGKSKALRPATEAIKSGVLAAARAHGGADALPVRIFETGDAEEETLSMFNLAKSQGAAVVIGPLTRSAVNYLADSADFSIPVLALNSFDEATLRRPKLYSFGLSIELEVQQIVRLMRNRQVAAPAVLVSPGPLSARMAQAFAEAWSEGGGAVPVQIEVKQPRAEAAALQAKLKGADAVFFASDGRRASLLRPYLPAALPCYATSQITVGRAVPVDLSGVNYVEMPWLAEPDTPEYAVYGRHRSPSGDIERLFALGVDAWRLADALAGGRSVTDLEGLTGRLTLSSDGTVVRELAPRVATVRHAVPPSSQAASGTAER
ncbi:hypothetical protein SAMN05660284_01538 [Formivibrio citricus]|uniref:Penicillin-binding protein activator n=1 Tax=Formivibrio citricus TaxID=83765 RepID=A0A1I4Z5I7_9NEIS|nr:penicillin-binding protein activator [Formivibrio citricus]SFN45546.1 hypothetical protein SAMN05660284_01538 [Formivibrio citricus]